MAHANVYIRKENERRWASITDKSAWVNAFLEKSPPNSRVIEQGLEPAPVEFEVPASEETKNGDFGLEFRSSMKTCKHGSDPRFCKFAKPGKVCK